MERYEAAHEFVTLWREIMAASHEGKSVDFDGKHYQAKGAKLLFPTVQRPYPPLFFGGSSEAAHELAAEKVDLYITWGETPEAVAEKIADVRQRAAKYGRTVRFGIRLHVIVRETEEQAWAAAEELISKLDDETIDAAQSALGKIDSEGQRRMSALAQRRQGANPCGTGDQPQPVGRRRPGARRCRYGAGRRSANRCCADQGICRSRHRHLRAVRLSASGRVVPRGRTAVPAAAGQSEAHLAGHVLSGPFGSVVSEKPAVAGGAELT